MLGAENYLDLHPDVAMPNHTQLVINADICDDYVNQITTNS